MEYVVIRSFTDKDSHIHYTVGDRFPYRGFASKARVLELSTANNKRGVALIEEKKVEKKVDQTEVEPEITKSTINSMTVAEVRELAKQKGIENADELSGNKLKKTLIELMGL
jgi:hypothetical protein